MSKEENKMSTEDVVIESFDDIKDKKVDKEAESIKKEEKVDKKPEADKKVEDKKPSEADKKEDKKVEDKKPSEADKKVEKKPEEKKASETDKKVEKKPESEKKADDKKVEDSPVVVTDIGKKSGKGPLIAIGIVASLLIIAYISGFIYFSGHFYQDVAINGLNVSNMNSDVAQIVLDNFYKDYKLTIEPIDSDDIVISADDIDAKITVNDSFSDIFKQQEPALWFVNMFNHHDYTVNASATWNEDKLTDIVSKLSILDEKKMVKPADAYVGVEDGKFAIIKEVMGSTVKEESFDKALHNSLSTVQATLNLVEAGCYKLPKVHSDDEALAKELEGKNEYAQYEIKIQMDDLLLEPGMELYEAVLEKKGDEYEISKSKVDNYVKELADKYDSLDKERKFTTSFGNRVITTKGKAFGYVLNQEKTKADLYSALTAGKSSTVEATFDSKGKSLIGENDIGDTYVEVNLSEQRVIAYKDGKKIAEGDCVSGNESAGHGTDTGLYEIQDKLSPTVLRGEKKPVTKTEVKKNKKGKKVKKEVTKYEYEYESPVTYWLQFNGGQGLHDAAGWRSAYGGSIYYYSGSHGCVNLPLDLAKTLYQNFEVGDPVIVYFWDNENRK
ncbi:MAG: L,D-transpeptidase family protein [Lachnospiraceae bacterium]|nr:L,D-transpeptidase family protein [Lachnospiraceae bacterium]